MVKVIGKTEEEWILKNKTNRLEEIAKGIVGDGRVGRDNLLGGLYICDDKMPLITIIPEVNTLVVTDPRDYNLALKVAETYEKETKEGWSLKKDYFD